MQYSPLCDDQPFARFNGDASECFNAFSEYWCQNVAVRILTHCVLTLYLYT